MSNQNRDEIAQQLDQANECQNYVWQMWNYVAKDKKLVLCGHRYIFDVTGYLIFYGTTHIRLPSWAEKAVFRLGEASDEKTDISSKLVGQVPGQHLIVVSSKGKKYSIVCQGLRFYPFSDTMRLP